MSWPDPRTITDISMHQRTELIKAFSAKVSILTGCPGSGKTWTLAKVLKKIMVREDPSCIAVCAYTGKAAVRATESMTKNGVPLKATTIHRLLSPQMDGEGRFTFAHNANNQLPLKYLVIDEVSMLGMVTCSFLFPAIPNDCFMLLVGDHHQLPPVEKGAVLRDYIAAGMPHGDLKEIFRNSGQIVHCCKEIREGRFFCESTIPLYGGTPEQNLAHVETSCNEESIERMLKAFAAMRKSPSIDLMWSAQVLSFINEGSELSRKELNATLQGVLNPNQPVVAKQFTIGDKVICLKNRLYAWTDESGNKSAEFVANGQMGQIVHHEGERARILLKNAVDDHGVTVWVGKQVLLEEWDLGYAISIHKSQGSSWPIVFVMVDHSPRARFMASRQLIYTAISRAEKYCLTIGQRRDINEFCRKDAMQMRVTGLVDRLKEDLYDAGNPIWT